MMFPMNWFFLTFLLPIFLHLSTMKNADSVLMSQYPTKSHSKIMSKTWQW